MKTKILMVVLFSLLVILAVSPGIPAGNKADEQGQDAGKGAKDPDIEMGMFVNRPLSYPPWYPHECEDTDSYRWAPRYYWPVPSISVYVNPLGSGDVDGDDDIDENDRNGAVAAVVTAFGQWNGENTDYSATVTRNDSVGPSLDYPPDEINTVSWGTIDGPGIIAITYFWYDVRTKELIDCDIVFNKDAPWSISEEVPSTRFDVRNIAAHEAGHTLVLDDLRSPRDGALTMHAYTWLGDDVKRDLGSGDKLGIQAIYGAPTP